MARTERRPTNGILYIAIGSEFVEEAKLSAESVRNNMGDIPITIVTDSDVNSALFDKVIKAKDPKKDFKNKIKYIRKSPYERTLFLDTDTYVDDDVSELFDILNRFDMGMALSPYRSYRGALETEEGELKISNLPDCFPQYNSGVIVFKSNDRVGKLFDAWKEIGYSKDEKKNTGDQISFMEATYLSDVRYLTLPREYNFRYRNSKDVVGNVKIFHGRLFELESYGRDLDYPLEEIKEKVNTGPDPRVCMTNTSRIRVASRASLYKRVVDSIKKDGIQDTITKATNRIIK